MRSALVCLIALSGCAYVFVCEKEYTAPLFVADQLVGLAGLEASGCDLLEDPHYYPPSNSQPPVFPFYYPPLRDVCPRVDMNGDHVVSLDEFLLYEDTFFEAKGL